MKTAATWLRRARILRACLRGKVRLEPCLEIEPEDIFLASYGKSGNTWMRFLIANLINGRRDVSFKNIEHLIPYERDHLKVIAAPRPRIIKTHRHYTSEYRRVICVTRDPRDVAASFYHYEKKIGTLRDAAPIDSYIGQFLEGRIGPRSMWREYGSWGENVGSWLGSRWNTKDFLWFRYEDLMRDPESALRRVAAFLNLDTDDETVERAVRLSSVNRMRELEQRQANVWEGSRGSRKDIPFVRSAKVGAWSDTIPIDQARRITEAWGKVMGQLGYRDNHDELRVTA